MKKRARRHDPSAPPQQPERGGQKLARLLDIPQNAMSDMAQIELLGNREAVVEGCKGILEYSDSVIKLNTSGMVLKISGRNLRIKVMTASGIVVEGFFTSVEFIS